MQSLKDIKTKITSYQKTGAVTHAMEAVSAVKMRKSQQRSISTRPYAAAAQEILERLSEPAMRGTYPLMQTREGKTLMIVVTSDKGLAGALNSAVIKRAEKEIADRNLTKSDVIVIAMGRRGGEYFTSRGYDVHEKYENMSDDATEADMRLITDKVLTWHAEGIFGTAVMVYTHFKNTFEQNPSVRQIIPIMPPAATKNSAHKIEPDPEDVLRALLPKLLNIAVYHGLLESKASEHSARMVAMKSATDKAKDMAATFTRTFNKARQAAITREVSEIVGGIEAMK